VSENQKWPAVAAFQTPIHAGACEIPMWNSSARASSTIATSGERN